MRVASLLTLYAPAFTFFFLIDFNRKLMGLW